MRIPLFRPSVGLGSPIQTEELQVIVRDVTGQGVQPVVELDVRAKKRLFRSCESVRIVVRSYPIGELVGKSTVGLSPWTVTGLFRTGGYGCSGSARVILPRGVSDRVTLEAYDAGGLLIAESVPVLFVSDGRPPVVEPRPSDVLIDRTVGAAQGTGDALKTFALVAVIGGIAYAARPVFGVLENVTE